MTPSSTRRAAVALAILLAAFCLPSYAQSPKAMSEAELKAANGRQLLNAELARNLIGNSSYYLMLKRYGPWTQGGVAVMFYRDDRHRVFSTGQSQKRETIWWFEGNDVCGEQRITNAIACYRFFELGGAVYMCERDSADCFATVRFVPGNPENL